ncbi:MAG: hypothetical protein AVDCRST_MAG49-972 [uncultured Thermomicrobiales bacterium]|uniref:Uncharacterized protein n=1 Tax=uncultured Thermomicrobiales bacterium TaxID=1645740 RepID=A0A6J4U9W0_9BACT|nr:MAG: hypothetical protein AVDCRST_MAG49-972 [uncultured Thermomicrobiales bacterium]
MPRPHGESHRRRGRQRGRSSLLGRLDTHSNHDPGKRRHLAADPRGWSDPDGRIGLPSATHTGSVDPWWCGGADGSARQGHAAGP